MASIHRHPDKIKGPFYRAFVRRKGFAGQSKIFESKKDATVWAASLESKMRDPTYRDLEGARKHTVASLFERYREEVVPARKGARWEVVRINSLLRNAGFTKRRLDQLKFEDIRDWRDARLKQVSAASVNRELNLISGVFSHAIKEWSVPLAKNPCALVSRPAGANRTRNRRWTDTDVKIILDAAGWDENVRPGNGREMMPWALLIALETAMRPSEMTALKVEDFHPDECCVRLHDSKTDTARDVPLSSKALKWFRFITEGREPDQPIFYVHWEVMSIYFRDVRKTTSLANSDLRFRDARHEATTRLSKKFSNVLKLSAVTGHKSLQSLKRYYNPTAAELAAEMD
jgi:integrase